MTDFGDPSAVERMLHAQYVADIEEELSAIVADDRGTTTIKLLDRTVISVSRTALCTGVKPIFDLRLRVQTSIDEAYSVREQFYSAQSRVQESYTH